MGHAERVVLRLMAHGKPGDAAVLAQRAEALAASGEQLVAVRLVPDVPDDAIFGRVVHAMDRDGDLHGAERCPQMAAGPRDRLDDLFADLAAQRAQLLRIEPLQRRRVVDLIENSLHVFPSAQTQSRFAASANTTPNVAPTNTSNGV